MSSWFTLMNCGLWLLITQVFGEMVVSQSVKAYSAFMVAAVEMPGARSICISTCCAVLSVSFLIFIFPWSLAFMMESISCVVVMPYGVFFMCSVFLSIS